MKTRYSMKRILNAFSPLIGQRSSGDVRIQLSPPPKFETYRLEVERNGQKRKVESLNDAEDASKVVELVIVESESARAFGVESSLVEDFYVQTKLRSTLICVKVAGERMHQQKSMDNLVVLFCQPAHTDLGSWLQPHRLNLESIAVALKLDVYSFDYSGYGYSTGTPSEKNIYADVQAVYGALREARPDKHVVLVGYELGAAAAIDFAATEPDGLAGLVLISPFTSELRYTSPQKYRLDSATKPNDRFTNIDKIGSIDVPVLILHGENDKKIPVSHSQFLHKKLKRPLPLAIVKGADHETIISAGEGKGGFTFARILRFLHKETSLYGEFSSSSYSSGEHAFSDFDSDLPSTADGLN